MTCTEVLSHLTPSIKDIEYPQWDKCIGWPAVSDRRLEKLNQLLWVSGVGPRSRHHLAWPQEGHFQGHGVVVEDEHLVLLLPQILQSHLGEGEGDVCSGEQEVIRGEMVGGDKRKKKGEEAEAYLAAYPVSFMFLWMEANRNKCT